MISIKELSSKDMPELVDILHDAFKHDKVDTKEAKKRIVFRKNCNIYTFGIYLDEALIGTGSVLIELKMFKSDKPYIAHIEDVAIDKEYRGFGYGQQLIKYLIEFAKLENCYKVILYCSNDNIKFYKKCGFRNACNLMRKDLD